MNDPKIHVPMSETLAGIRSRAGRSQEGLSAYLQMSLVRVQKFEAATLTAEVPGDQELLDHYGRMTQSGRTP